MSFETEQELFLAGRDVMFIRYTTGFETTAITDQGIEADYDCLVSLGNTIILVDSDDLSTINIGDE